nr:unnamed protein product [Callosobruchus analis]
MTDTGESGFYYGRNRFKWCRKKPTRNVRTRAHNIVILPSVRSHVKSNTKREGDDYTDSPATSSSSSTQILVVPYVVL